MNSSKATLQLFERSSKDAAWTSVTQGEPVMVGTNGLAWGYTFTGYKLEGEPEKHEGDKRTPAGFFALGPSFGFKPSKRKGHIQIQKGETICVEDTASPYYNTITTRSAIGAPPEAKMDEMGKTSLFRNGIFVQYASDAASARGSCILMHVWKTPTTTTKGCVALPEARVRVMLRFAAKGAVLGVLPETARERFPGCPLPAPEQTASTP